MPLTLSSASLSQSTLPNVGVEIVVADFATTVKLQTLANLIQIPDQDIGSFDATVEVHMPVTNFKNTFLFHIDNVVKLDDPNNNQTDLHFYINDPSNNMTYNDFGYKNVVIEGQTSLVSANGVTLVSDINNSSLNQQLLAQDWVRYLASKIFGTPRGVDLIYNETTIVNDLANISNSVWNNILVQSILQVQTTHKVVDSLQEEVKLPNGSLANLNYLDNTLPANNVFNAKNSAGQFFFNSLITKSPKRFSLKEPNSEGLLVPLDTSGFSNSVFSLPFVPGDIIYFPLTVQAGNGQVTLTNSQPIPDRTYRIKIVLQ
jgi:hypothetical protein